MESWRIVLPAILLSTVGCQTARLTEPLERENRCLEDVIYQLQDELHEAQAQLASCRRENATLRRQQKETASDEAESLTAPPEAELGSPTSGMPSREPSESPRPNADLAPPFQEPPVISPPDPGRPDGVLPDGPRELPPAAEGMPQSFNQNGAAPGEPRQLVGSILRGLDAPDVETNDYRVVAVTLNKQLTGGHNRDNRYGDDGVMVVIEPRNKSEELVKVPGKTSIVVLDPALEGPAARLARWDFTESEVTAHYKRTPLGNGYHFALPWPAAPPRHSDLMLFVRYTMPDGQQFVVEKPIIVKLDDRVGTAGEPPATDDASAIAVQPVGWHATAGRVPTTIASNDDVPADDPLQSAVGSSDTSRGTHWTPRR